MRLTVRDAATLLHVAESEILSGIRDGSLPAHKSRERYMLNGVELMEWAGARGIALTAEMVESLDGSGSLTLAEALRLGGIHYDVPGSDREGVLRAAVERLSLPAGADREYLVQALLAREAMGSTAVGRGIAIPHVRRPVVLDVPRAAVSLCLLSSPVEYGAPDGEPVRAFFLIVSPTVRAHLNLLARLAHALRDPALNALIASSAPSASIMARVETLERGIGGGDDAGAAAGEEGVEA
ncbi:MAG TPA: PTS sugar transporter subunit IIA [Longimicrobiales bacterium]